MRCVTAIVILLWSLPSWAATQYYVAKEATGTGTGLSWTNAWTNFNAIVWSSPVAGDTINVSGGPTGGTNLYVGNLSDQSGSPNNGSSGNPITIKSATDAAHNGLVKIIGGIFISKKYWTIDGSKSAWTPGSVLDTYNIGTNINIEVVQTNNTDAVQVFGTGTKVKWVYVSSLTSYDNNGFSISSSVSSPVGDDTEIAYCKLGDVNGFGIRCEVNDFLADTFGQMSVHHCDLTGTHDNYIQISGHVDIYKNIGLFQKFPTAGHPDVMQEGNVWTRFWDNIFGNSQGAGLYVEANAVLNHDILAYNNVFYATTNGLGSHFDITGHDNEQGQACNLSNVWIFNNTIYNKNTQGQTALVISWNRGNSAGGRPSGAVSNFWFMGNNVIGVAPFNNNAMLQFFTNETTENGVTGFSYNKDNVRVDFNSINGASGNGQGILYGIKGDASANAFSPYPTMAAFAVDYPQYASNNNSTAKYVSAANTDALNWRPQVGDAALAGRGTNMVNVTGLTNIAPEMGSDIVGTPRGNNWTIGAFQVPAGYWVATNGNDSAAGSFSAPWLTIQHAVNVAQPTDTIYVTPGEYNEYVTTARNGTNGGRITISGYPENDPNNPVITRQIRVEHTFITITGLKFTKAVGINGANIRVEAAGASYNGSSCIVSNNTIADGVFLLTQTADFGSNYIHIRNAYEGGDFNTAGFAAGMAVWLGADSLYAYTNCGPNHTVLSNSADGLTMYFTASLSADTGTNYWACVSAGNSGPDGWVGVVVNQDTAYPSPGCSNVTIVANIFSNLLGVAIHVGYGNSNRVTGNFITRDHGQYAIRFYSSNSEVDHNFIISNRNIIFYTSADLSSINHQSGSKYYDYQCNLTTTGGSGQTNVDWDHNWVQDCDNALGEFDAKSTADNIRVRYNVYVGCQGPGNAIMNDYLLDHNTFWRIATGEGGTSAMQMGGKNALENDFQLAQTNLTVYSNAFPNFGEHALLTQEAPYGPQNVTNGIYYTNYSVSAETMLWSNNVTPAVGGTFGLGDPLFVNAANPLGPDGIPFTDDDGLRPMPNSPLAIYGIGALQPVAATEPRAHFTILLAPAGWKDPTGTNFNPAWEAQKPHERTDNARPWATPEAMAPVGVVSITATLNATNSCDGSGTATNTQINSYGWNFGDGTTQVTSVPSVTHTWTTGPTNVVTLSVTNGTSGAFASYSNPYRLPSGAAGGGGGGGGQSGGTLNATTVNVKNKYQR